MAVRDASYRHVVRLIEVAGRPVELQVRRSSRVRSDRIYFRQGQPPELVVRPRATDAQIEAAIDYHLPWLERQLASVQEARLGLDRLTLSQEQGRTEARARISLIAQSEAAALGVSYRRLTLRDQRSRWGSCSTTGVLSYSWRLILAPPFVLDYLAVHEVAHLVEMNHSPRFWRLVNRLCPDAGRAKAWLDLHGGDLHRYGLPGRTRNPSAFVAG